MKSCRTAPSSSSGTEIAGKKAYEIANLGIGYVPENRDIFPGLTTRQNLTLGLKPGQKDGAGRWSMQMMFEMFENLDRRTDVEAIGAVGR